MACDCVRHPSYRHPSVKVQTTPQLPSKTEWVWSDFPPARQRAWGEFSPVELSVDDISKHQQGTPQSSGPLTASLLCEATGDNSSPAYHWASLLGFCYLVFFVSEADSTQSSCCHRGRPRTTSCPPLRGYNFDDKGFWESFWFAMYGAAAHLRLVHHHCYTGRAVDVASIAWVVTT